MAAQTPPYVQQNGSHTAALFRQAFASLFGATQPGTLASTAGGVVNTTDLAVTAQASPNMTVNVAGGSCWIPQTQAANGGLYFGLNDATVVVAIAASNATNPRVDLICATVNDAAYSGSTNNWTIQAITGTPTAGANLTNKNGAGALPAASIPLAYVLVPAASTSVTTGNIQDARTFMSRPMIANPAGRLYATATTSCTNGTQTQLALGGSSYLKGGMTQSGNTLVVPVSGYYQINASNTFIASSGYSQISIVVNGTATTTNTVAATATYGTAQVADIQYVTAGQAISVNIAQASGSTISNFGPSAQTEFLAAVLVSQ